MSKKQINRLNEKSLQGNILIEIRNKHIESIVKKILNPEYNIIPLEYIDEKIRLECIKKKIEFIPNNDSRIIYLNNLLLKECSKGTSKIISEMCL
jgi:hypothetical protein